MPPTLAVLLVLLAALAVPACAPGATCPSGYALDASGRCVALDGS